MKKLMLLALSVLMSASLMACGGGNKEEESPSPSAEAVEAQVEEEADVPENVTEAEEVVEEAEMEIVEDVESGVDIVSIDIPAEYNEWIPDFAAEAEASEVDGNTGVAYLSTKSFDETKTYYVDKIASAGFTEMLNQDQDGVWMYSGMMNDTQLFTVMVMESEGMVVTSMTIT